VNSAASTTRYPKDNFLHLDYWYVGYLIRKAAKKGELSYRFKTRLEIGRKTRWYLREGFTYERAADELKCEPEWAEICHKHLLFWLEQQFKLVERRDFL
jgi:hypothetical protein